jgi:hypothetical protein
MRNLIKKLVRPNIILPILTLLCLAGFIGSYIFPNRVLDTYVINMEEEEGDTEVALPLSLLEPVVYEVDTGSLAMRGIQVGINKRGSDQTDTVLSYQVFIGDTCVSKNTYAVAQGADEQYVYLPFENYEQCIGALRITFLLSQISGAEEKYPALMANHREVDGTVTTAPAVVTDLSAEEVSLKCSYIYTHETYPFLYDFRLLTFVFLAAAMTVSYSTRKKKEGRAHETA